MKRTSIKRKYSHRQFGQWWRKYTVCNVCLASRLLKTVPLHRWLVTQTTDREMQKLEFYDSAINAYGTSDQAAYRPIKRYWKLWPCVSLEYASVSRQHNDLNSLRKPEGVTCNVTLYHEDCPPGGQSVDHMMENLQDFRIQTLRCNVLGTLSTLSIRRCANSVKRIVYISYSKIGMDFHFKQWSRSDTLWRDHIRFVNAIWQFQLFASASEN